jgi:hypothetical protein
MTRGYAIIISRTVYWGLPLTNEIYIEGMGTLSGDLGMEAPLYTSAGNILLF